MGSIKYLEEVAKDIKRGDLIKVHLDGTNHNYVGYAWITGPIEGLIYLTGFNPNGKVKYDAENPEELGMINIFYVMDAKNKCFFMRDEQNHKDSTKVRITAYEILKKAKH